MVLYTGKSFEPELEFVAFLLPNNVTSDKLVITLGLYFLISDKQTVT